jgi:hypothetical protein
MVFSSAHAICELLHDFPSTALAIFAEFSGLHLGMLSQECRYTDVKGDSDMFHKPSEKVCDRTF